MLGQCLGQALSKLDIGHVRRNIFVPELSQFDLVALAFLLKGPKHCLSQKQLEHKQTELYDFCVGFHGQTQGILQLTV